MAGGRESLEVQGGAINRVRWLTTQATAKTALHHGGTIGRSQGDRRWQRWSWNPQRRWRDVEKPLAAVTIAQDDSGDPEGRGCNHGRRWRVKEGRAGCSRRGGGPVGSGWPLSPRRRCDKNWLVCSQLTEGARWPRMAEGPRWCRGSPEGKRWIQNDGTRWNGAIQG